MARSITDIQNEIIAAVQADANLAGLTSPSAVAIWRLWTRVIAASLETEEQLNDLFRIEMEQLAREAVPGTADWLQKRVLEFQYDALSPQIVTVIDGKATYSTIDESLRIVTRAAVVEQSNGRVLVKVAKDDGSGGLDALSALELSALTGYLDAIGFVGIPIDSISQPADRVGLNRNVEIYYLRQYDPATVKANIITSIGTYLSSLSIDNFNGVITKTALIDAIQSVEGVLTLEDFVFYPTVRAFGLPAPNGPSVTIQRATTSGYAVVEDTPGYTIDLFMTMVPDDQIPER
jgi:hypothetical protein